MYSISNAESKSFVFNDPSLIPTLLNNISDAFILLDSNWQFIFANQSAEKFLNQKSEYLIQQSIYNIFPFEKGTKLFLFLVRAFSNSESVFEDFFSVAHLRLYRVTAYPSHNGLGILIADISDKNLEITKFGGKLAHLQEVFDSIPQIVWVSSPIGEIINLNTQWTEYTGLSIDEGLGYKWIDRIHPDDIEKLQAGWERSMKLNSGMEHEYRLKAADGAYRWHLDRNRPVYDQQHKIILWIGTATEIHNQKLAQEELKERNYFVQKITEASPDIIGVFDLLEEKYIYISDVISSFLGISSKEFLSMSRQEMLSLIHPDDLKQYLDFKNDFIDAPDDEVKEVEFRIKKGEKNWSWLKTRAKVFKRDRENNVIQITGITQNISKQKEAEDQQIQNAIIHSLLEKKEEFVSIASHELKAPVANVKASIQILKRLIEKETDRETLLVFVSKANQQIAKLTELIKHLLENAKLQSGKLELKISTFYVEEVVSESISHIINNHRISVRNSVFDPIQGDKNKIEQVIINYLTNALKYSPQTNQVILETERVDGAVRFSITDFGIGIPSEKVDHVFDRFYRVSNSSADYSGIGLGLYISAEIVKLHNGKYGVISEEGKGSTFWFTIPVEFLGLSDHL